VQLLKNFPAFNGTRRFITAFTRALHWSVSWARSIQSIPSYLRSILILSTHLRLGLPNGLFLSGFPTNIVYAFLFSPIRATCRAHLMRYWQHRKLNHTSVRYQDFSQRQTSDKYTGLPSKLKMWRQTCSKLELLMLLNFISFPLQCSKSLELPTRHIASKFNSDFQGYSSLGSTVLSNHIFLWAFQTFRPFTLNDEDCFCLQNSLDHDAFYTQHCKDHVLLGATHFILFVHCLFNDAANSSAYIASNGRIINEWWIRRMWKETVID
jgi:hypothetical protein